MSADAHGLHTLHTLRARARDLLSPFRWDLFGFALSRAQLPALVSLAATAAQASEGSPGSLGCQAALYLCATVAALFTALAAARVPQERRAPQGCRVSQGRRVPQGRCGSAWGMAAVGAVGALAVAVGVASGLVAPVVAGCACSGASAGYFETVWGGRFVTLRVERIQAFTLLMTAVAAALGAAVGFLAGPAAAAVVALLPLGAAALYARSPQGPEPGARPRPADAPGLRERRHRALVNILASVLVLSTIYNFVVTLTYDYLPAETASQIRFAANLACALGLLALSVLLRPLSPATLFRLVLPVIAVGFVLYLMAPESLGAASLTVSSVGRKLFDILTWVLVAQAVQAYSLAPGRCFGFLIAGKNLGYLLGLLLATVSLGYDPGVAQIVTAVPVLLLVLIVVFFWLFPERSIDQLFGVVERPAEEGRDVRADLEEKARLVARRRGCTPREAEVLGYLAKGRTQAVIAAKLGISTGTAHTHIVHVYQKLGVSRQQELIELVEAAEATETTVAEATEE